MGVDKLGCVQAASPELQCGDVKLDVCIAGCCVCYFCALGFRVAVSSETNNSVAEQGVM